MRLIAHALLVLVIAAAIGLGLTWATASRGTNFGTLTIGTWTARPKIGTSDINPYARASVARSGELPLAAGDGIACAAKADDTARPLDGRCDVTVSGVTPPARFWTLTLYDLKGQLIANGLQRYGFTSEEIVRNSDGSFVIHIAPRARSGNWLPTAGVNEYQLLLRLYDTPVGVATRTQRDAPMPALKFAGCP